MRHPAVITTEVFARFLRCELEADLHSRGVVGRDHEFRDWQRRSREVVTSRSNQPLAQQAEAKEGCAEQR